MRRGRFQHLYHLPGRAYISRPTAGESSPVKEGTIGSAFYVILEGRAKVVRGTRTIARLVRVLVLVADVDIRVLTEDGELLRHLTLDPIRDYQRRGPVKVSG